jgi:type I restriction-modification system DNA methylase subunit
VQHIVHHPAPARVAGFVLANGSLFSNQSGEGEIRKHGHVLTPGRYVGAEAQEDDGEPFPEKIRRLTSILREQRAEAKKLDKAIAANLAHLGYSLEGSSSRNARSSPKSARK